jgi:hypothetical protein
VSLTKELDHRVRRLPYAGRRSEAAGSLDASCRSRPGARLPVPLSLCLIFVRTELEGTASILTGSAPLVTSLTCQKSEPVAGVSPSDIAQSFAVPSRPRALSPLGDWNSSLGPVEPSPSTSSRLVAQRASAEVA